MDKEKYIKLDLEIVEFDADDVISTSIPNGDGNNGEFVPNSANG